MDNAIGLGIILSLQDRASAGLENVRNRMTALRDVSQEMMKKFDEGAKQMVAGFASMAAGAKVLGVLNSTFGASVTTATDFEQAMARVGAVSGATGEDFERLSKQARDLGRDTQFSATQAAASQENLARAGFQTNEIISAMPGLLNMAAAEGMDLANAADIASSAIRGFGLDASEANRVADVLAKTSASSNTSIALLGESLKYVAPLAKGLGISIEQTNAMLGVMANAGIKGSQAGTSLKSAFQRLSEEPTMVTKALAELGVKAKTAEGDLRPMPELMKDLSAKMEGLGKGDKIGILSRIFGGVASSGMLAIMDAVANGSLPELETALYNCSGAAKEMADRMNATAKGAMLRLESASEGLRIVIGNHLLPVYTWIIDKMAQFKSWLTQLIEAHPVISKAVIGFTAALIGLSGATLLVVGGLASISGFMKMWPLLKIMAVSALSNIRMQARMALASFSKLTIPIVGLVALAGILFYAWRKNLWGIRDMVTAVSEGFKMALSASTDGIAEVDEELANKLKAAGIWDFAVTMGKVFFRVRQFWNGLVEGFKEGLDFLKEGVDWLKSIFSPVIESGQELLKFLGILKPVAKTQAETWKAWGQLIGRIAPIILTVIAAFKGIKAIIGIFGTVGNAIGLIANPVGLTIAAILALVAAGIYVYNHWEEISEWFAELWENMAGYAQAAADWVKDKWQAVEDWWNSWTIADVFDAVRGYISRAGEYVMRKINDLKAWWNSWTLKDVFAPVIVFAQQSWSYVKQKWADLQTWWDSWTFADVFAPLKEYAESAKEYIAEKWDSLRSWWDSWTFGDIFAPMKGYAQEVQTYITEKWDSLQTWWDSWTFADVFAPVKEYAGNAKDYALQKLTDLQTWWNSWTLNDVFSPVLEKGKAVWDSFSSTIETVKTLASEKLSGIWDKTVTAYEQARSVIVGNVISPVLEFSWNALVDGWNAASNLVGAGFEKLKGLLHIDFSGFWDTLSSGFATVCDTIKGAWNGVTGFIKDTWNTAADYVSGAWDWTKGLFGFGEDSGAVNQEQLKAQVQDITVLNKMSEGFAQRVAEMTAAWQPFKASLGEGFEQIYTVMQSVADKINNTVIPAVNSLVSALSGVARELASVSQAGNLDVKVKPVGQPTDVINAGKNLLASGGDSRNMTPSYMRVPAYAAGGIITQPHIGLVGEAGREAIVPLEDRNSGIPLLMSAISELGVSNNDILPYLNPVAPEIETPSVNLSAPTQPAPAVNIPAIQTVPADVSVQPMLPSQPVVMPERVDISGIERTVEAILASFANLVSHVNANAEQPNVSLGVEDRIPTPTVNVMPVVPSTNVSVAPVVSPADVSVQPLFQSLPVVNVPTVNLPEVSAIPLNVSVPNNIPELSNAIVQAIKSIDNKNDAIQGQVFNSPLSVQPTPVSVQPPDVFTAPLDLSGFRNVISGLIDNLDNKDTSIKLVAPQNQAPSSPLLIQHSQNQAVMNGQAQVRAQEQSPDRPVNVNNHVDVVIEGKPVELYIDGERVGSAVLRWTERQSARSGVSEF